MSFSKSFLLSIRGMIPRRALFAPFAVAAAVALLPAPAKAQETLTIFAAASMKNALDDVSKAFQDKNANVKVVASYAASSALAKQLESGAPADVFISADLDWMKYGIEKKTIKPGSDFNLLGNRLVLIAPKDSKLTTVKIEQGTDLAALAGGRIATGDVRAVPVGKYAKAALEKLGIWAKVEPQMAMAENVRAALALVSRGEAPLGIVYETDAKVDPGVKIVGAFPADSYPAIVYPAGLTVNAKPAAEKYIAFLRTTTAQVIFERYGFTVLVKAGP